MQHDGTACLSSAGALAHDQQHEDEAAGELFGEFAVAPEDIFGDDVHIPDIAEEEVEDNSFVFDQAAQLSKDSPARSTSSLTFGCELPASAQCHGSAASSS